MGAKRRGEPIRSGWEPAIDYDYVEFLLAPCQLQPELLFHGGWDVRARQAGAIAGACCRRRNSGGSGRRGWKKVGSEFEGEVVFAGEAGSVDDRTTEHPRQP